MVLLPPSLFNRCWSYRLMSQINCHSIAEVPTTLGLADSSIYLTYGLISCFIGLSMSFVHGIGSWFRILATIKSGRREYCGSCGHFPLTPLHRLARYRIELARETVRWTSGKTRSKMMTRGTCIWTRPPSNGAQADRVALTSAMWDTILNPII
jgi:hypothetical protein